MSKPPYERLRALMFSNSKGKIQFLFLCIPVPIPIPVPETGLLKQWWNQACLFLQGVELRQRIGSLKIWLAFIMETAFLDLSKFFCAKSESEKDVKINLH